MKKFIVKTKQNEEITLSADSVETITIVGSVVALLRFSAKPDLAHEWLTVAEFSWVEIYGWFDITPR